LVVPQQIELPATGRTPTELVFLVDRSGSMGGRPIAQVKRALQFFLRSLPEETIFNSA